MPVSHNSSFLQAGCPSCCPTNSIKALKAKEIATLQWKQVYRGCGRWRGDYE